MNSIILNIIAYLFMTIVLGIVFTHSTRVGKWLLFANFCLFGWSCFMLIFLITHYENIKSQPLNVTLNTFEMISNFLTSSCVFVMYLNMLKLKRKKW
jgi:hypothetical protein